MMAHDQVDLDFTQGDLDISDPAFYGSGDPQPIWRRMREEDPVHLTRTRLKKPFWSITRYADARFVFMNDNRIFSLQRSGAQLPASPEFDDPDASLFTELSRSGAQLAVMDGQPHSALRSYFSDRFSISGVRSLEQLVRDITQEVLEDL